MMTHILIKAIKLQKYAHVHDHEGDGRAHLTEYRTVQLLLAQTLDNHNNSFTAAVPAFPF